MRNAIWFLEEHKEIAVQNRPLSLPVFATAAVGANEGSPNLQRHWQRYITTFADDRESFASLVRKSFYIL